jgi:hypothetical protein
MLGNTVLATTQIQQQKNMNRPMISILVPQVHQRAFCEQVLVWT